MLAVLEGKKGASRVSVGVEWRRVLVANRSESPLSKSSNVVHTKGSRIKG